MKIQKNLNTEEYSRLCSEIQLNFDFIMKTATIAFTLYMAIMGFGINYQNGTIIALALFPIIMSIFTIHALFSSTERISAYIAEYYENSETNIYWETKLYGYRSAPKFKHDRNVVILLYLIVVFIVTILTSIYYYGINPNVNIPLTYYIPLLTFELSGFVIAIFRIRMIKHDFNKYKMMFVSKNQPAKSALKK